MTRNYILRDADADTVRWLTATSGTSRLGANGIHTEGVTFLGGSKVRIPADVIEELLELEDHEDGVVVQDGDTYTMYIGGDAYPLTPERGDDYISANSTQGPYWPDDDIALLVWAAVGARSRIVDEEPEATIAELRADGYTWDRACADLSIPPWTERHVLICGAWAGIARMATARRDAAVRHSKAAGVGVRDLVRATGLSSTTAVARIIARGEDR